MTPLITNLLVGMLFLKEDESSYNDCLANVPFINEVLNRYLTQMFC
jgi:hypothetical protein